MNFDGISPGYRNSCELALLRQSFSNVTPSKATNGTPDYPAHYDVPMTTSSGRVYVIRLRIPPAYPDDMPVMLVINPKPLRDKDGNALLSSSAKMHVLTGEDGGTKLCHFDAEFWDAGFTLHKVAMKGLIWLESYEGHIKTGQPIDFWLPHMKRSPDISASRSVSSPPPISRTNSLPRVAPRPPLSASQPGIGTFLKRLFGLK